MSIVAHPIKCIKAVKKAANEDEDMRFFYNNGKVAYELKNTKVRRIIEELSENWIEPHFILQGHLWLFVWIPTCLRVR